MSRVPRRCQPCAPVTRKAHCPPPCCHRPPRSARQEDERKRRAPQQKVAHLGLSAASYTGTVPSMPEARPAPPALLHARPTKPVLLRLTSLCSRGSRGYTHPQNDEEFLRWYFAELDGTPQHRTGAPKHNRALERKLSSKETAFRDVTDGEDPSGFQFLPTSDEIHEHAGNYRSAVYLHLNEHHHHEFIKEGHVKGKRGNSGACKLRACRPACVHARVLVRSVGACLPMPWHLSVTRGSEIGHRESFCASSFD